MDHHDLSSPDVHPRSGAFLPDLEDPASVRYSLFCPDSSDRFIVDWLEAVEELGRPYRITVRVAAVDEGTDSADLLGRDVRIILDRADYQRELAGIVAAVIVRSEHGELRQRAELTVLPALSALELTRDTRIFQDKTALQIIEDVLREGLGRYRREFDASALYHDAYATRDFCVQYQESSFDFVHRLMEEEGIGYCFEHGERERLRLFSKNRDLHAADTMDRGPVRFDDTFRNLEGAEPMVRFDPRIALAPATVTVRDHDWTRARPTVEQSAAETGDLRPHERTHEIYQHGFERHLSISEDNELLATMVSALERAVMPHGIPTGLNRLALDLTGAILGSFTSEDAEHQARIRREELRRDASTAKGVSLVTGFSPGYHFTLIGHPTLGADGAYLITKVTHRSAPTGSGDAPWDLPEINYRNELECIPLDVPWRPRRTTRKPRVYGVQTARVMGPLGMDVFTDQHGRIKVKFNWDRREDDLSGNHTCWIRVSQAWAGHGFPGFVFIPRVGMEVVVAFVDGDPDRPLVTGCVYNGANPTPTLLPVEATKSIIRTRTVPHGPGYNELSFEDAMGMERIHIRAQRDLDELVLRDHSTVVMGTQINEVAGECLELCGDARRSTVEGDRTDVTLGELHTQVSGGETRVVLGSVDTQIGGPESISVERGSRIVHVVEGEHVLLAGGRLVLSQGGENHFALHTSDDEETKGAVLETPNTITLRAGEAKITMNADGSGGIEIHSPKEIKLVVGGSTLVVSPGEIRANSKVHPASG